MLKGRGAKRGIYNNTDINNTDINNTKIIFLNLTIHNFRERKIVIQIHYLTFGCLY